MDNENKNKIIAMLNDRRGKDVCNREMICPVMQGEFCKTTKCMWYEEETQECCMLVIAKTITGV